MTNINWDDAAAEAAALLSEFIAIDTSNPPGNEEAACAFLGGVLRREGLEYDLYETGPGRVSLVSRLRGDGSAGPLILLNHTDVVPVEREFWNVEPFGGEVRDGYIWGRGALDMKSMGIFELLAVLLIKRLDLPLRRDVVFFAVADEVAGSEYGIRWFSANHPELLKGDFCLNEGAFGWASFGGVERPFFGFSPTEKNPLWLRLRAEGPPGHGSLPHNENALGRLVRALDRIQAWGRERIILPEMRPFFERLAQAGALPPVATPADVEPLAAGDRMINALTQHTISLTTCHSGIKANVIPAQAEATLDCRLLAGESAAQFTRRVRDVIDDERVSIESIFESETPPSRLESDVYTLTEQIVREYDERALVLPVVSSWFTDSRAFRQAGTPAYGFIPVLLEQEDYASIHGHNERISLENVRLGTQVLFELVRRIAVQDAGSSW
jgi:acetylornithine deacetylase/succinyl-diaminopimelate desuccinylase-like protein